jgi:hypothetical protein
MRSPIPLLLSLSLPLLTLCRAAAETADEFFHGGAQSYLSNNIPGALEVVTNGLQRFPKDVKLQKLYELLNQQQQQQQQDQENQEQQQQPQKDQPQKPEEQQQQEPQAQQDQPQKDSPAPPQQDKRDSERPPQKPGKQKAGTEAPPVAAHEMTPEEAKQLLDAQKGEEQVLIFPPPGEPKSRTKQLKDW